MYPAEDVFPVAQVSLQESHVVLAGDVVDVSEHPEFAELGGKLRLRLSYDVALMDPAVVLQLFDGDEGHVILFCQLPELRGLHHGSVFIHDLAADAALGKTGQAQQVHRRLGVAVSDQHAAPTGDQREYMARPPEILRL